MQQLIGYFISIFLFAGAFVSSAGILVERQEYRISKQNLNLIGRELINYIWIDSEKGKQIDENAVFERITELNHSGEILGCIFSYESNINVLKRSKEKITKQRIDTKNMYERNKINTINQMMSFILCDLSERFEINIASNDANDYLTEELFNRLAENTVFIIGYQNKNVFLSGFVIE